MGGVEVGKGSGGREIEGMGVVLSEAAARRAGRVAAEAARAGPLACRLPAGRGRARAGRACVPGRDPARPRAGLRAAGRGGSRWCRRRAERARLRAAAATAARRRRGAGARSGSAGGCGLARASAAGRRAAGQHDPRTEHGGGAAAERDANAGRAREGPALPTARSACPPPPPPRRGGAGRVRLGRHRARCVARKTAPWPALPQTRTAARRCRRHADARRII